jgi:hypothetical protein
MRRPLWQTLVEVVEAVMPAGDSGIRVKDAYMDLPLEVRLRQTGTGLEFLADLPGWRWETVFDEKRGRMKVVVGQGETQ